MKFFILFLAILILDGCQPSLDRQARFNVYAISNFYADKSADRLPLDDTYTYRSSKEKPLFFKVDYAFLKRGQQRYEVYCSVCHGDLGDGNGLVTSHGFPHPPSYHSDTLRKATDEHFYDVITNGRGRMFRLGDRIEPKDRWAIISYIRALQLSQNTNVKDLSASEKLELGAVK